MTIRKGDRFAMTLREILTQDIAREIEGVVKADDRARIGQEIREYVVTAEIARALTRLFEGYQEALSRQQQGGTSYPYNGVWISGYFGSGKSHLLKILAYLLSDAADDELRSVFLQKIDEPFLRGAVETAFRAPATSVLFNIDQQADAEAADTSQQILFVFERVFNRAAGYCENDRVIANFERDLDERGTLEAFRARFREITGEDWRARRDTVMTLDRDLFTETWSAFQGVDRDVADSLLDRYDNNRTLSAEQFATRVRDWLDRTGGPTHRLNFFVDEVGQFVANDRHRMLNLQTVAESLATTCNNRAWVFVTSQEDIDAVIGDASAEQRNDFTRITARFYFRLPLTSANVEEVIQRRLLDKTEAGTATLYAYYDANHDHLRTLFHFGAGVKEIRYRDRDHFALSFPFPPYQFYYLQEALKGLSAHNAFTGRHVSRGERSMLEVFQDVGKQLAAAEVPRFATFDQMFDGIRQTLQSALLRQVELAERELGNPLAVRLLKALLLLKYTQDFTGSPDNLTTLLISDANEDRSALRHSIQEALDILEYQSYVRRGGDEYEYLTDREKDVAQEIKNTDVDYSTIRRQIHDVVVDRILKHNHFTYDGNGETYRFATYVDEEGPIRRVTSDLALRIITHLHPNAGDTTTLLNHAMGRKELLVVLPVPSSVANELRLYNQTDTYLRHTSNVDDPHQQHILAINRSANNERETRIRSTLVPQLVTDASLYVGDRELSLGPKDPHDRLHAALQELVRVSYPNLQMLRGRYSEAGLRSILFPEGDDAIFSGDAIALGSDEAEMQGWLQRQKQAAVATTIATVKEEFAGGQYGWPEMAILSVLAKLIVRDAVELADNRGALPPGEVHARLINSHAHAQVFVRLAQPIDSSTVGRLATFYQEFFHAPATASGGKELVKEIRERLGLLVTELQDHLRGRDRYPFLDALDAPTERYRTMSSLEESALITTITEEEDDLLMEKLETVDRAVAFVTGPGAQTLDRIREYIQTNRENFSAVDRLADLSRLEAHLSNKTPWAGNAIRDADRLLTDVRAEIDRRTEASRKQAARAVDDALRTLQSNPTLGALDDSDRTTLLSPLSDQLTRRAAETASLPALEHIAQIEVQRLSQTIRETAAKRLNPDVQIRYAAAEETRVTFSKPELVTAEDVDAYVEAQRTAWRALVADGKRIMV